MKLKVLPRQFMTRVGETSHATDFRSLPGNPAFLVFPSRQMKPSSSGPRPRWTIPKAFDTSPMLLSAGRFARPATPVHSASTNTSSLKDRHKPASDESIFRQLVQQDVVDRIVSARLVSLKSAHPTSCHKKSVHTVREFQREGDTSLDGQE